MAFIHGKFAYIAITDSANATLDLTGVSSEADYPQSIDTAETSHFGSQSKTYVSGLDDATISIKGMFDATVDAAIQTSIDAIKAGTNASMTCTFGPAGNGTGKPKYTMSAIPTGYEVDSSVGGMVSISLSLQRTGSTTRSTFA